LAKKKKDEVETDILKDREEEERVIKNAAKKEHVMEAEK